MNKWALPGESSVKIRVANFRNELEYSWKYGNVSQSWPISIEIHPTNRCQLQCSFCKFSGMRFDEYLPTPAFERLITSLTKMTPRLRSVVFSGGGEPSLHPYLPEAIHRLTEAGVEVGVITNGVYMSEALKEAYLKCTWVRFSLNFPSKSLYTEYMSPNNPRNFDKVLSNMRTLAEAKNNDHYAFPTLGIAYIITRRCDSDEDLLKCVDIAADARADFITYRPLEGLKEERTSRARESFARLLFAARSRFPQT